MSKRILYIQYTNPALYPPLEHSSHILAAQGWKVLFLGIGALNEANQLTFAPHPSIDIRLLPYAAPGWRQKVHYFYYCLWVLWTVFRWRPQWVYASDPLVTPIAWILTFLPFIKVLYHEHDVPAPTPSAFFQGVMAARHRLALRADAIVIPNEKRSDIFRQETGTSRPIYMVWNCPRLAEVPPSRPNHSSEKLKLLYHGSVVPERLPLTVIEVLVHLPDTVELDVIGYETIGFPGYLEQLRRAADEQGVGSRFRIHSAMPRHQLMQRVSDYDIGLVFMPLQSNDLNMRAMVGASNKAFDYMAGSLALLVNDEPEWKETYVEGGYAYPCLIENAGSFLTAVQWYLDNTQARIKMGQTGRQQIIEHWNYETMFQPVLTLLTATYVHRYQDNYVR